MCDYCKIVDNHNDLKEIAVSEIDVGKFGKFELSTYISGFPYPALSLVWIYTDKDGIIQKENTKRKEIEYCSKVIISLSTFVDGLSSHLRMM